MTSVKYIGLDVHKESISVCVRNSVGKVVMECVIETKASTILQFIDGLRYFSLGIPSYRTFPISMTNQAE